ncbi:SIS domain-containing protein [Sphingomonas aerophila]|uniref:Tagatose-6-phosphate ketose/aldose isomerase n=1 Tax=Sphingomonas aerophila TaxID=1344948 RepID=A0A7W9EXK1_9SPHN|nr:SIS domain-containing protein [Sphingomonas aerophila]MBB5716633.1 tagatose-6-phosphate ketose/aldose isomerase [Sphingomonas aerophila]
MPDTLLAIAPTTDGETWTEREIRQQPATLGATQAIVEAHRTAIEAFIAPLLARPAMRVVLTGAGTSAFIGDTLAPYLSQLAGRPIESVPTTDIVSAPDLYLRRGTPLLLVSFGRSGNSPESLAAIDVADAALDEVHHLIITCNPDGALAARGGERAFVLLLPEETHDRGFAMTSSFTAMMLAALSVFGGVGGVGARVPAIADAVAQVLDRADPIVSDLAGRGFDRVVYLGSGVFKGLAREAALKLMELSDGAVVTAFDTAMGFRHGPKTIVTSSTLIVVFVSNDPLTARYDRDIVEELRGDGRSGAVVVIATSGEGGDTVTVEGLAHASDCDLLFPFIVPAQLFGLRVSEALGLTPDQPNRTGTVNRVVEGVRIYAADA